MRIGFPTLLAILFIGLKLAGIITWSWFWVLSPLWIGFAIFLVIFGFYVAILLWSTIMEDRARTRRIRRGF
jgi:hypothetical protein